MAAVQSLNYVQFFGGRQPDSYIYEDDECVVFEEDIESKQAPIHFLVVPKRLIRRLVDDTFDDEKLLGHLLLVARHVAKLKDLKDGFRVVMNEGAHSCQRVDQFYVQVLGGRQMGWPFCHILLIAQNIALQRGLGSSGYHVMVDEDHRNRNLKTLHIFGRALHHMVWPMGPGTRL